MEVLDDDCCELEASTRHSNASRAAAIAKKLAEKKAPISVRLSELPLDVPEIPLKYAILRLCCRLLTLSGTDYDLGTTENDVRISNVFYSDATW